MREFIKLLIKNMNIKHYLNLFWPSIIIDRFTSSRARFRVCCNLLNQLKCEGFVLPLISRHLVKFRDLFLFSLDWHSIFKGFFDTNSIQAISSLFWVLFLLKTIHTSLLLLPNANDSCHISGDTLEVLILPLCYSGEQ